MKFNIMSIFCKLLNYFNYFWRFVKSEYKTKIVYELLNAIKEHGLICGFRTFIHQKIMSLNITEVSLNNYQKWLLESHIPNQDDLLLQKNTVFEYMPLMSIVTPTYNTPKNFLIEMIESVIAQSYDKWELCIADGASTNQETLSVLRDYQQKYPNKIKVVFLTENYHISGNTNEAIKLVSGDYVSFFDHDDLLTPNCLFEYVKKINEDNKPALLYCDEDKTDEDGTKFFTPFFKPDFGIFTIRSNNYICHLMTIRKDILDKVGALDSACDGAQDYDLVLRIIDHEPRVSHVSKILYHWRVHANSTASGVNEAKPYTHNAGRVAIMGHLERNNLIAEVNDDYTSTTHKINYLIVGNPLVSIVIPNKDHIEDLELCINSIIEKTTYKNFEVIIVENNSTEKSTFEYYETIQKQYAFIKVVRYETNVFNFSKINNFGVSCSRGEYLLLLNNDTSIITSNWIEEMLMYSQLNNVGAVGAKLYFSDYTIQHGGVVIGTGSVAGHKFLNISGADNGYFGYARLVHNVSAVTAACLMIPKQVFIDIGGLSEEFAVAFNDIDLCMKIRKAGYDIVMNPHCELYHYESKSRGYEDTPEKKARFQREIDLFDKKWGLWLDDPYYNVNFTKFDANYNLKYYNKI